MAKIKIYDYNSVGQGISKDENDKINFVENAMINEIIEYKVIDKRKNYNVSEPLKIIEVNKNRRDVFCSHFDLCGGCNIQYMNLEEQRNFKVNETKKVLKSIAKIDFNDVKYFTDSEKNYRNKATFAIGKENNKVIIGFYKNKTHEIINLEKCYIHDNLFNEIIIFLQEEFNNLNISTYDEFSNTGTFRHIVLRKNEVGQYMLIFITRDPIGKKLSSKIVKSTTSKFPQIISIINNINENKTNKIFGSENYTIFGVDTINEKIGNFDFKIRPDSFFQVNYNMMNIMYNKIIEKISPGKKKLVFDFYCGIGTITFLLSEISKEVIGIEANKNAIKDANENLKLNNISNIEFIDDYVENAIQKWENKNPDLVVLDPPRKGCAQSVIEVLNNISPREIIYVSCNPSTFARDYALLKDKYDLKEVDVIDMFPNTYHIELVTRLERK